MANVAINQAKLLKPSFVVIFITSQEKYVIKAFKTECFEDLLKPIDPIELADVGRRIEKEKNNT